MDPRDFEDYGEAVDTLWDMLPLEQLRRDGEVGWDADPNGPIGAERFDNVYNKVIKSLHISVEPLALANLTE